MCGIAGIVGAVERTPASRERVSRMVQSMHHRGPDDAGVWESEPPPPPARDAFAGWRAIALGFRHGGSAASVPPTGSLDARAARGDVCIGNMELKIR